jgi:DNA replication and repair protein RecF
MIVESLALENWRNALRAGVEFDRGLTLFTGPNAQGKTNLLEAIFLLATGRSHRTSRPEELVAFGADMAHLRAHIERPSGSYLLTARIDAGRVTRLREGKLFRRGQDPLGDFRAVLFAPEDLLALKGAPADRRRLLDLDAGQGSRSYREAHLRYGQVLRQRNAVFHRYERPPQDLLATWDAAWAQAALGLTRERRRLVERLAPHFSQRSGEIAGSAAATITYEPSLRADTFEEALGQLLARREDELRRRTSLVGPHRDDLRTDIGGRDLRLYGSQGEQRTVLVAFKLAAVSLLSEGPAGPPVLLLDDVLSELDQDRRRNLLMAATGTQTVVTTTESSLAGMQPGRTYAVRRGEYMRTW